MRDFDANASKQVLLQSMKKMDHDYNYVVSSLCQSRQASVPSIQYLEHTERSIITFVLPRYAAPGVRQATPASTGVRRPLEYATLSFKCSVPRAGLPASSMYCAARYAARQVQSFQALNLGLPYLTTIADPWYFWKGSCTSKAHKPVTLSGNATFTKV